MTQMPGQGSWPEFSGGISDDTSLATPSMPYSLSVRVPMTVRYTMSVVPH